MRVLLDTHVFLWAIGQPALLSPVASEVIRDPDNSLLVSAATAWEIATKHRIGKLPGAEPVVRELPALIDRLRAAELSVTVSHALLAGSLHTSHRDPFDRVLAAQAMVEEIPLITSDPIFGEILGLSIIWKR